MAKEDDDHHVGGCQHGSLFVNNVEKQMKKPYEHEHHPRLLETQREHVSALFHQDMYTTHALDPGPPDSSSVLTGGLGPDFGRKWV